MRLDILLKEKGFFESREKAQLAIRRKTITVNGKTIEKAAFEASENDDIQVIKPALQFVSIGGEKLNKALSAFRISLNDQTILDVGASTGGFTDCCLQHGAKKVYAVDVGQNQLHPSLSQNPRIISYENKNIRELTMQDIDHQKVDWIVMDVSFTSITKVLPHVLPFLKPQGNMIVLIKPQFEMDTHKRQKGGIIKDPKIHKNVLKTLLSYFHSINLTQLGIVETDIEDEHKNLEFLAWLQSTI